MSDTHAPAIPATEILNPRDRIAKVWGSVEIKDTQGDLIPITEFVKFMPTLMKRGGNMFYEHKNKPVGKILGYEIAKHPETGKTGLLLTTQVFDDYTLDHQVWEGIKSGDITGASFGGSADNKKSAIERLPNGDYAKILRGVEGFEFSYVKSPANSAATFHSVNYVAKANAEADVKKKIEHRGDKWVVTTADGSKVLGTHDTKEGALAQLRAVEANKSRVYLAPGEKPPAGVKVFEGDRGGRWYESGGTPTAPGRGERPEAPDEGTRWEGLSVGYKNYLWGSLRSLLSDYEYPERGGLIGALGPKMPESMRQSPKEMKIEAIDWMTEKTPKTEKTERFISLLGVARKRIEETGHLSGTEIYDELRNELAAIPEFGKGPGVAIDPYLPPEKMPKEVPPELRKAEDGRPPKAWWDSCISSVSQRGGVDDPSALCGWVFHHVLGGSRERASKEASLEFTLDKSIPVWKSLNEVRKEIEKQGEKKMPETMAPDTNQEIMAKLDQIIELLSAAAPVAEEPAPVEETKTMMGGETTESKGPEGAKPAAAEVPDTGELTTTETSESESETDEVKLSELKETIKSEVIKSLGIEKSTTPRPPAGVNDTLGEKQDINKAANAMKSILKGEVRDMVDLNKTMEKAGMRWKR